MQRKHLQMTYKIDETARQQALAALDAEAASPSDATEPLDLPELPDVPEKGEEHTAERS